MDGRAFLDDSIPSLNTNLISLEEYDILQPPTQDDLKAFEELMQRSAHQDPAATVNELTPPPQDDSHTFDELNFLVPHISKERPKKKQRTEEYFFFGSGDLETKKVPPDAEVVFKRNQPYVGDERVYTYAQYYRLKHSTYTFSDSGEAVPEEAIQDKKIKKLYGRTIITRDAFRRRNFIFADSGIQLTPEEKLKVRFDSNEKHLCYDGRLVEFMSLKQRDKQDQRYKEALTLKTYLSINPEEAIAYDAANNKTVVNTGIFHLQIDKDLCLEPEFSIFLLEKLKEITQSYQQDKNFYRQLQSTRQGLFRQSAATKNQQLPEPSLQKR